MKKSDGGFEKEANLIEAVLYLETDPLDNGDLSRKSGLSREVVQKALEKLEEKYRRSDSGMELSRIGGGVTLSPKQEYWDALKEKYGKKNDSRFSRAALETLSIIAYSQPVTRSEVEAVRGVKADAMIQLLVEKGLVEKAGKKDDALGKPVQYRTTREFLRFFRLESIADLPKLEESEAARFALEG